ncbi:MAG: hypothetical protein ACPLZY_04585 [Candidatus Norongarragalinales archaeon]
MAYSKRSVRQTYAPSRRPLRQIIYSPSRHSAFKVEWESNLEPAITRVQALKKEGYLVDEALQRGALTESQAERIAKRLKEMGYEIQTIPIATWAGEKVVFLVSKPPAEPVAPKPTQTEPTPPPKQETSPEEYLQRFLKTFYVANDPDIQNELDRFKNEGFAMDRRRVVALISKDAPQKYGSDSLVGMAKQFKQGVPLASFAKANDLLTALRRAKGGATKRYGYVAWEPDMITSIEEAQRALKILDPKTRVAVYCKEKDKPVYFMNPDGNAVAVAPVLSTDPAAVIDVNTLMRNYGPQ